MSPTAAEPASGFFRPDQPVEDLKPSALNPRKDFDDADLAELAESMKGDAGVIEPIVARSLGDRYEIVCGERRWRAAQKAGLKTVPVIVKRLTDAQALEVMVIENDQRKDVTALERAHGYAALMKADPRYADRKMLAGKIGRSVSWVHAAMKLLDLIPAAQKALLAGAITEGHAILVARLQPSDQAKALSECQRGHGDYKSTLSVRALDAWISREIYQDLNAVPFQKDDGTLLPEAGPCTTCPKRSGANPAAFPGVRKDSLCSDRACYQAKVRAFVNRRVEELSTGATPAVRIAPVYYLDSDVKKQLGAGTLTRNDYRDAEKKSCPDTRPAVIVHSGHSDNEQVGKALRVCVKKNCPVHSTPLQRSSDRYAERASRERRAKEQKRKARRRELEAILLALRDKVTELRDADLRIVAVSLFHEMQQEDQKRVYALMAWPDPPKVKSAYGPARPDVEGGAAAALQKANGIELARFLVVAALAGAADVPQYMPEKSGSLYDAAKRWKVDAAAIEKRLRAEAKAKAVQTSAPKKSAAKKKR